MKKSCYQTLDESVLSFVEQNIDKFNATDILEGLKESGATDKSETFKTIFNTNESNTRDNNSFALGWLIGTKYVGTCGEGWEDDSPTHKFYIALKNIQTDLFDPFECCEGCNCGNGTCIHVVDSIALLKHILGEDWSVSLTKYGYYDYK